jgi:hypothetical protein
MVKKDTPPLLRLPMSDFNAEFDRQNRSNLIELAFCLTFVCVFFGLALYALSR